MTEGADVQEAATRADPAPLSATGRRVRLAVTAVVLGLLVLGTFWGEDDHFPFGPFRMYATSTPSTGRVAVVTVRAETAAGEAREISAYALGMRRAELEGQLPRLRREPELLGALADTYHQRNPEDPRLVEVRLERDVTRIDDGEVVAEEREVLATWRP